MLSKEGKTDFEIARQLEMGVGEVRLVLELSKGVQEYETFFTGTWSWNISDSFSIYGCILYSWQ